MTDIISGEDKAWEILAGLSPEEVCRRTRAEYDAGAGAYRLQVFGAWFSLHPQKKEILSLSPEGDLFLTRLRYFFVLSILWYLVKAVDTPATGRLVKPAGMPGGDIFFRGTHVLPLDALARRFAHGRQEFTERGLRYGGSIAAYGDASVTLHPFPQIPVTVILWLADEEWDARADLLFDSSALSHLPIDVLWSIAMMTVLVFL